MKEKTNVSKRVERGILSLVFLLLLGQAVLFVRTWLLPAEHRKQAAALLAQSHRKRPDTLFYFDPNYATTDEFVALGLSYKQAAVIVKWRTNGGYFWQKEDFAKMYTVSDSLYRRLEPYLVLNIAQEQRLELNSADSAALDALPGIGPYYVRRILAYRERLGGYRTTDQLLEAGVDSARWRGIRARLWCDTTRVVRLSLSSADPALLARHPYFGSYVTSSLVRWRNSSKSSKKFLTLQQLVNQGIVSEKSAKRMEGYWKF